MSFQVSAQVETPEFININFIPNNGYFSPLSLLPDDAVQLPLMNQDQYEIGYYYTNEGERVDGYIKMDKNHFKFKKLKYDFTDKIKPDEARKVVIGLDSFFVITNIYEKDKVVRKEQYVKLILEDNGYLFAQKYELETPASSQSNNNKSPEILAKHTSGKYWDSFEETDNFKELTLKYFGHISLFEDRINDSLITIRDLPSIIKQSAYYSKYQNNEPIYFNEYWDELGKEHENQAKYTALIDDFTDSSWVITYYQNSTKLYQATYSSLIPLENEGPATIFYPNGNSRQEIIFKSNKPDEVKVFLENGSLKKHYKIIQDIPLNPYLDGASTGYTIKVNYSVKYIYVGDSTKSNIIDSNQSVTHIQIDPFNQQTYYTQYEDSTLKSYYHVVDGKEIHQITDQSEYNYKLKKLSRKFKDFIVFENIDSAYADNAHGIIYVQFIMDEKGRVIEEQVLNSIHPVYDTLLQAFIDKKITNKFKFKRLKIEGEKKKFEVVIPFVFNLVRYYNTRYNYQPWYMRDGNNFSVPYMPPTFPGSNY